MKKNKKPWSELREERCPKCKSVLTPDLFGNKLLGCSCGFDIKEEVKTLLVNRENNAKL